jgi:ATP-binding cassette subfamily B multidrug efflux pump
LKAAMTLSILGKALSATFRRMWPLFILMVVTAFATMALELAPPLILKNIIDNYLDVGTLSGIWVVAAYYLAAALGTSILGFGQVFINTYIGQNILLELRLFMAEHLNRLPMSYYSRTPVGETMSRLTSDVETVNTVFSSTSGTSMGLGNLLTDVVKIIGILVAMYFLSPELSLIVLAAVPVIYITSDYFRKGIYRTQLDVRRSVGRINTFLQETFSGMKVVKTYGKESHYEDAFQKPLASNLVAVNGAAVYDSYFPCVMMVIRTITIAVVVWFGAKTGLAGSLGISIGSLAAMTDLVTRLFSPLDALTLEFQTLQQALAGLKRIVELLMEKPEEKGESQHVSDIQRSGIPAIAVKGLSFGYQSGRPVLRDISLNVEAGKRIAIVGRTGAGKTTLMSLIAGLYAPEACSISIMGYDPFTIDPADRRKLLGVVPQNVYLFEGTVRENITLRDDTVSQRDVEKATKTVGLDELIAGLENGYDTLMGVEGIKLSFGQSQLLSLARAVVFDPAILLLDEPTSGVDALTEANVFQAFRKVSEHRTIVTISHRLSGIIDADEVHIMAGGRIVQSGAPEKLAGESGWYSVYRQLEDLGWKME